MTICDFGNASSHEVVRDRTIRNSFVSEKVSLNNRIALILKTRGFQHERCSVQGE